VRRRPNPSFLRSTYPRCAARLDGTGKIQQSVKELKFAGNTGVCRPQHLQFTNHVRSSWGSGAHSILIRADQTSLLQGCIDRLADDVLHGAVISLRQSLRSARPASVTEFLRLAAFHIRRELTRLSREYYGPSGWATHHAVKAWDTGCFGTPQVNVATRDPSPSQVAIREENIERLCVAVDQLSEELRDVVDLLWSHGLQQQEAARILGVTRKTVQRRWVRARLRLFHLLSVDEV